MQPNPQLRRVLATLDDLPGLTPADARRVGQLIVGNPYLLEQFNRAAASGALKGFALETDGWNAASFRAGIIRLVPGDLRPGYFDPMALTFLFGHEIQHANDPALRTAFDTFIGAADAIARSGTGVHDYTAPLVRYLDTKRDGEGLASIAGFNAVHAALVAKGIPPTVENMLQACPVDMAAFLDDGARGPKRWDPSLRLAHDGSLQAVPGNVTVMNWRYFHANDGGKDYDYLHKYAAHALGYALYNDRTVAQRAGRPPPRFVVDFRFLGLTAAELQLAGLAMDPPQRIYERPTDPSPSHVIGRRRESLLDGPVPSASGDAVAAPSASVASVGRPVSLAGADGLTADAARAPDAARASAGIREADGRSGAIGDALDVQARAAVARLDADLARAPDTASERLAAAVAALARAEGLQRVDHVLLNEPTPTARAGETVFVVQGELDSVHRRVAQLSMHEALDPATPGRLAERLAPSPPADEPAHSHVAVRA